MDSWASETPHRRLSTAAIYDEQGLYRARERATPWCHRTAVTYAPTSPAHEHDADKESRRPDAEPQFLVFRIGSTLKKCVTSPRIWVAIPIATITIPNHRAVAGVGPPVVDETN